MAARPKNATEYEEAQPARRSSEIAKRLQLKRATYASDVTKLVMKIRAASYRLGGSDLEYLFGTLDKSRSGTLDFDEFKRAVRRCVRECACPEVGTVVQILPIKLSHYRVCL